MGSPSFGEFSFLLLYISRAAKSRHNEKMARHFDDCTEAGIDFFPLTSRRGQVVRSPRFGWEVPSSRPGLTKTLNWYEDLTLT